MFEILSLWEVFLKRLSTAQVTSVVLLSQLHLLRSHYSSKTHVTIQSNFINVKIDILYENMKMRFLSKIFKPDHTGLTWLMVWWSCNSWKKWLKKLSRGDKSPYVDTQLIVIYKRGLSLASNLTNLTDSNWVFKKTKLQNSHSRKTFSWLPGLEYS